MLASSTCQYPFCQLSALVVGKDLFAVIARSFDTEAAMRAGGAAAADTDAEQHVQWRGLSMADSVGPGARLTPRPSALEGGGRGSSRSLRSSGAFGRDVSGSPAAPVPGISRRSTATSELADPLM